MPPELKEKLEIYLALLRKWQGAVNLVSADTLDEAWERHFKDSLQLAQLLPSPGGREGLFDLGSGAGFPGLVLAMALPALDVTLIESDTKKCTFLSTVSRETQTPVNIINDRIESVSRETIPAIITARALAPLDKLLGYCLPWAGQNPALTMFFLKGAKAESEIKQALEAGHEFTVEILPSKTAPDGRILKVTNLRRRSGT